MSTKKLNVKEISLRISAALASSGKKSKDIAAACGISEVTMSKYVNGVSTPKNQYLIALAQQLNVSVSWLLTGKEEGSELEQWKRRALEAEHKLKLVKSAMEGWLSKL